MIDIETALLQQLLNIAQRERIAKIPPDRTEYEAGFGLPPFEDRGSGSHFAILSRHQPAALKVATHPKLGTATAWQIVGVFHDIRNGEHLTDKTAPQIFAPYWQSPWPYVGLAVRTALDPAVISKNVRDAVAQALPGYSLAHIQTMQQTVNTELKGDRFGMVLFGMFAVLALLLAALGIYGVLAFAVAQRSHEIGLRMALGAQQRDVVLLILGDGMKLGLAGVGIGLVGVVVLGHLMRSTLYGIKTIDAGSFAAVALVLMATAVLASYIPARRSARVDPMIALRQE